jgi:hypothetical protein
MNQSDPSPLNLSQPGSGGARAGREGAPRTRWRATGGPRRRRWPRRRRRRGARGAWAAWGSRRGSGTATPPTTRKTTGGPSGPPPATRSPGSKLVADAAPGEVHGDSRVRSGVPSVPASNAVSLLCFGRGPRTSMEGPTCKYPLEPLQWIFSFYFPVLNTKVYINYFFKKTYVI